MKILLMFSLLAKLCMGTIKAGEKCSTSDNAIKCEEPYDCLPAVHNYKCQKSASIIFVNLWVLY